MSATASSSSFCSMPDSVCEGLESSESNNMLLMALMEETQEDQYYADDRLVSMIQSLEAELSSNPSSDMEVEQADDKDCSTSSSTSFSTEDWDDGMEVVSASSSSSFDEEMLMDAWSLCAADGNDSGDYYSSELYYDGLLLENYLLLPQE